VKARFPFSLYKVTGHSMEPVYKEGDLVLSFNYSNPKVGTAVLFNHNRQVYLKRITQIRDNKYYLAGDNQVDSHDSKDFGWVGKSSLVGSVVKKFP
jgi:signal peptidase I